MRDSLYFFYVLVPRLCMRMVIFKRAHVYLNEENERLFVVQRGKARKVSRERRFVGHGFAFRLYFLNPPLTLRLLTKSDTLHASFVLLL